MPPAPIATVLNTTPTGRRVNSAFSQMRGLRDSLGGLDKDFNEYFALVGFDPANPSAESAAAVAGWLGLPDASHVPAALGGLLLLRQLDFTTPLSRFASPVG